MIDFTNSIEELNLYKGSEKKKTLVLDNKKYLVKFPDPISEKNKKISYVNNAYSEYIGSNIFKLAGFETQNTILGKYYYNGKEKIVCACEDFTDNNHILYEFENLAISSNPDRKIGTDIDDIMEVLNENGKLIDVESTIYKFWNMFIIDALIGNTDRHNGNWGFILDKQTGKTTFAPIYDCGSCLNPLLEDDEIENLNETQIKNLAINCYSCLKVNNSKINYISYIKEGKNNECNKALIRVFDNINISEINSFIDGIDSIGKSRKDFYKKIVIIRYNELKSVKESLQ